METTKEVFEEIYIPDAVYEEVVVKGRDEAGSAETESAVMDGNRNARWRRYA